MSTQHRHHFEIDTAIAQAQPLRNPIPCKRGNPALLEHSLPFPSEEKELIRVSVTTQPFWYQVYLFIGCDLDRFSCGLHTQRVYN